MKTFSVLIVLLASGLWLSPAVSARSGPDDRAPCADLPALGRESPSPPQDTTRLVFRRVWSGPGVNKAGQPTPDGRYLTFVDWSKNNDVSLRDMQTGEVRPITNRKGQDPKGINGDLSIVSPDGGQVAYHWFTGTEFELHLVDIDGTNRRVIHNGEGVDWIAPRDWSRDGREIVVSLKDETEDTWYIGIVSVADGSTRKVKDIGNQGTLSRKLSPRFSRDARHIVYDLVTDEESGAQDIVIIDADGKGESRLVEHDGDDYVLGWVPDTDYLLFASDRGGILGAWVLKVVDGNRTGPAELVKPDLWRAWPMGFTADGSFYFAVTVSTKEIKTATIDPETGRVLTDPVSVDPNGEVTLGRAAWSPDGRHISYLTGASMQQPTIVIRSLETGETREFNPRIGTGSPALWSPDGRDLLINGRDSRDRMGLFLMDVQTGEVEELRIYDSGNRSFSACWSTDGRTVYYWNDDGKVSRWVALDVTTGDERVLRSVERPAWLNITAGVSPDGERLAFWETDWNAHTQRLLVAPTTGTDVPVQEVTVVDRNAMGKQDRIGLAFWSRDGRDLTYLERRQEGEIKHLTFWRVPVEGGEPQATETVLDGLAGGPPVFSPDGRRVAFETGSREAEVWVMKNYLPRK